MLRSYCLPALLLDGLGRSGGRGRSRGRHRLLCLRGLADLLTHMIHAVAHALLDVLDVDAVAANL